MHLVAYRGVSYDMNANAFRHFYVYDNLMHASKGVIDEEI